MELELDWIWREDIDDIGLEWIELEDMGPMNANFEVDETDLEVHKNFVEGRMEFGMVVFELEDWKDLMDEMVLVDFFKKSVGDSSNLDYKC